MCCTISDTHSYWRSRAYTRILLTRRVWPPHVFGADSKTSNLSSPDGRVSMAIFRRSLGAKGLSSVANSSVNLTAFDCAFLIRYVGTFPATYRSWISPLSLVFRSERESWNSLLGTVRPAPINFAG